MEKIPIKELVYLVNHYKNKVLHTDDFGAEFFIRKSGDEYETYLLLSNELERRIK